MHSRRRWRVWRAQRWLLGVVRALVYVLGFVVSLLAGNVPLPNDGPRGRALVNVIDTLSAPRLHVVSLAGGATLWLTGRSSDADLERLR